MSKISVEARDFLKLGLTKDQFERSDCKEMISHPWLSEESLISEGGAQTLSHVSDNLQRFCQASNFQKTVLSIMSALKIQSDELKDLKKVFI